MASVSEQLLEEYIRVINHKDDDIHRLIQDVERLQLEMRKKDDKYKSKLMSVKVELEQLQLAASSATKAHGEDKEEIHRLTTQNHSLVNDVATLRAALQKSDDHLQGVLRASNKAQKHESHAREKIELEFREVRTSLETRLYDALQRCGQLENQILQSEGKVSGTEKDVMRWKVEAQRMQHDLTEQQRLIKELKRRCREMLPADTVQQEQDLLEQRHRSEVNLLEKDRATLRDQLKEEGSRLKRLEALYQDSQQTIQRLEKELHVSQQQFGSLDVTLSQAKLHHASSTDELKREYTYEVRAIRDQCERERMQRAVAEGEVVTMRQRLADAEEHSLQVAQRLAQESSSHSDQVRAFTAELQAARSEMESLKRQLATAEEGNATLAKRLSDAQLEQTRLKSEVVHADDVIERHVTQVRHFERLLDESRSQASAVQAEMATDRNQANRREQEWRSKVQQLEDQLHEEQASRRSAVEHLEDVLREKEAQLLSERNAKDRDRTKHQVAMKAQSTEYQDRLTASEALLTDMRKEIAVLKDEANVRVEKERSLQSNIKSQDEVLLRLQLDVTERDATITTLRRNFEQVTVALRTTQNDVEEKAALLQQQKLSQVALEQKIDSLLQQSTVKEQELTTFGTQAKQLQQTALKQTSDLQRDLEQAQERVRSLQLELQASQQKVSALNVETARLERARLDEIASLRQEVILPLQQRLESIVATNQRLVSEVSERDETITDLQRRNVKFEEQVLFLQSEVSSRERKMAQQSDDLEHASGQIHSLRRNQQQLALAQEDNRRVKADAELLLEKIATLQQQLQKQSDELRDLHDREIQHLTELSSRKSEIATLKERYANLESLRNISDQNVAELQTRERDLLEKIEELRSAQQMMQVCFDKQQEQLEVGRRLREQQSFTQTSQTTTINAETPTSFMRRYS